MLLKVSLRSTQYLFKELGDSHISLGPFLPRPWGPRSPCILHVCGQRWTSLLTALFVTSPRGQGRELQLRVLGNCILWVWLETEVDELQKSFLSLYALGVLDFAFLNVIGSRHKNPAAPSTLTDPLFPIECTTACLSSPWECFLRLVSCLYRTRQQEW